MHTLATLSSSNSHAVQFCAVQETVRLTTGCCKSTFSTWISNWLPTASLHGIQFISGPFTWQGMPEQSAAPLNTILLHVVRCHRKKCHRPRPSSCSDKSEMGQNTVCLLHATRNDNVCQTVNKVPQLYIVKAPECASIQPSAPITSCAWGPMADNCIVECGIKFLPCRQLV